MRATHILQATGLWLAVCGSMTEYSITAAFCLPQPADIYATEALSNQSLRLHCNAALWDDSSLLLHSEASI